MAAKFYDSVSGGQTVNKEKGGVTRVPCIPPTDMKSKAELTPADRLLNRCSLCLMPPMIIQMPCAGDKQIRGAQCCTLAEMYAGLFVSFSGTHGYKQDTPEQGPRERRFHDLLVTFGAGAVSVQQRRDVEGHLGDGTKGRVHHCSHCEVTLRRNAAKKRRDPINHYVLSHFNHIYLLARQQKTPYLAIPMPI